MSFEKKEDIIKRIQNYNRQMADIRGKVTLLAAKLEAMKGD